MRHYADLDDLDKKIDRGRPVVLLSNISVDAVVSNLNEVFYLDLRHANVSDTPILVPAITITIKAVESYEILKFDQEIRAERVAIGYSYDINISNIYAQCR